MSKVLKVYFSGSSKDSKNNDLYLKIVKAIETSGAKVVRNWLKDKVKLSPEKIFQQVTNDIKRADILVAEISSPSTGVGQQIALAISKKIPVIALTKEGTINQSRFTIGTKSSYLHIIEYNEANIVKVLNRKLEEFSRDKFIKFNFITTRKIYNYIESESKKAGLSKSEFLRNIIEDNIK